MVSELAPLTKLDAVNLMLSQIGAGAVQTLNAPDRNRDADRALERLAAATQDFCAMGWEFNTNTKQSFVPDVNGEVALPTSYLRIDAVYPDAFNRVIVQRGHRLLNNAPGATSFNLGANTVRVDVVIAQTFEALPPGARRVVAYTAARQFAGSSVGNLATVGITQDDENRAWAAWNQSREVAVLDETAPITRLDAVNYILTQLGALAAQAVPPHERHLKRSQAGAALLKACLEFCAIGWEFNTDIRKLYAPIANEVVLGSNVLRVDAVYPDEAGRDLVQRGTRLYNRGAGHTFNLGTADVFVDRVIALAFEDLPQAERRVVVASATRQFIAANTTSEAATKIAEAEEQRAWAAYNQSREVAVLDETAPITRLDAVNYILTQLGAVAAQAVPAHERHLKRSQASAALLRSCLDFCAMGWDFNTDIKKQYPTVAGEVVLGGNVLRVDTVYPDSFGREIVQRGSKLYNRAPGAHSFDLGANPVFVDRVLALAFEDLPQAERRVVATSAARQFIGAMTSAEAVTKLLDIEEQRAWAAFFQSRPVASIDETTQLSRLAAVHTMVALLGPVSLQKLPPAERVASVGQAAAFLKRATLELCEHGWHFNTDKNVVLTPNGSGEVVLDGNVLKIDPVGADKQTRDLVQRGTKLWDRVENTFNLGTDTITLDIVRALSFDDIPPAAKRFSACKAARQFAGTRATSPGVLTVTEADELRAWVAFLQADSEGDDRTMATASPYMARMRQR